jgi:hypothetical protein
MKQHSWLSNYFFAISGEWRFRPRSWTGWANRLLILVNLRLMRATSKATGKSRVTVIRYQRHFTPAYQPDYDTIWTYIT